MTLAQLRHMIKDAGYEARVSEGHGSVYVYFQDPKLTLEAARPLIAEILNKAPIAVHFAFYFIEGSRIYHP